MKTALVLFLGLGFVLAACSGDRPEDDAKIQKAPRPKPIPAGPDKIVLVDKPVQLQDEQEPFFTKASFEFELPRPPRRARLLLRYSGVPGNKSEDYKMGRYRHKVQLNDRFLMDLNTFSEGEDRVVEHTKWISVGMFRRNNKLTFEAGDDGNREGRPNCDEYELRSVILEFDW
jgi:hypothetical protein